MRNPIRGQALEPQALPARLPVASCLAWAACLGLVAGTFQLLAFLIKYTYFDPRNLNVSRHFPWMYPVSGLIVIGIAGCVLGILGAMFPRRIGAALTLWALSFLAYLTFLFVLPIHTAACLLLAAALAYQTAKRVSPRIERYTRWMRRSLWVLAGLLLCTMAACFASDAKEWYAVRGVPVHSNGGENVLLIVLDTVRARSLSLYGHDRATTPNLARFASRGVLFENAYATAPWTAPSHASMFTGCWAHELSVGWERPLDRSRPTLAEFLSANGRATAGFVANVTYCGYDTGLSRGFAHYEDYDVTPSTILLCSSLVERTVSFANKLPMTAGVFQGEGPLGSSRKTAARIGGDFLAWQRQLVGQPFFAFLNFYDAHHPYFPPDPPGPEFGRTPETSSDYWMLTRWWGLDKRKLNPRQLELARDSYDQCIAYLDKQIGELLDELDRRRVLDNTLVIITADHGEHLGEHKLYGHGCSLYEPELHVPLLVLDPRAKVRGATVNEPVSLRDLAATVVERLDLGDHAPFPGRSLARYWSQQPDAATRTIEPVISALETAPGEDPNHGESPGCKGAMVSVIAWGYHYIRGGDGREELFEVEQDPAELRDIARAPAHAAVLKNLRALTTATRASGGAGSPRLARRIQ